MSLESEILSLSAYIKECWNEAIKKKAELETKYPQHNLSALCCAISELDASETVVVPEKYSTSFVFDGNLHPKTN